MQFHNPENVPESAIPEGRMFIPKDKFPLKNPNRSVPCRACLGTGYFSDDHDGKMFSANLRDSQGNSKNHEITMGMWRKCQELGNDYKDLSCNKYNPMITTQKDLRAAFWQGNEHLKPFFRTKKKQNDYSETIRQEWCEFVDMMQKDGHITEELANKVTL